MPDQEILNIDGAAALLGVSVKTFSKVLREGDVPGRKVGREWKFSRSALIDWVGSGSSVEFYRENGSANGQTKTKNKNAHTKKPIRRMDKNGQLWKSRSHALSP